MPLAFRDTFPPATWRELPFFRGSGTAATTKAGHRVIGVDGRYLKDRPRTDACCGRGPRDHVWSTVRSATIQEPDHAMSRTAPLPTLLQLGPLLPPRTHVPRRQRQALLRPQTRRQPGHHAYRTPHYQSWRTSLASACTTDDAGIERGQLVTGPSSGHRKNSASSRGGPAGKSPLAFGESARHNESQNPSLRVPLALAKKQVRLSRQTGMGCSPGKADRRSLPACRHRTGKAGPEGIGWPRSSSIVRTALSAWRLRSRRRRRGSSVFTVALPSLSWAGKRRPRVSNWCLYPLPSQPSRQRRAWPKPNRPPRGGAGSQVV